MSEFKFHFPSLHNPNLPSNSWWGWEWAHVPKPDQFAFPLWNGSWYHLRWWILVRWLLVNKASLTIILISVHKVVSDYIFVFWIAVRMYNNVGSQTMVPQPPTSSQPNPFGNAFQVAGTGLIKGGLGAYGERILGSSSEYVQSNVCSILAFIFFC